MAFKHAVIEAGFAAFRASGLHRAVAPLTRGRGVILTFHRVRPFAPTTPGYAPNRLLEVTPAFLDEALTLVRRLGFELVSLTEARRRLIEGGPRFAALTFDDGYRDTRDFALPVLEKHARAGDRLLRHRLPRAQRASVVAGAGGGVAAARQRRD